jgi:hypothetical protein
MSGLRVLITNYNLKDRAGSQLYARDVALGLLERGHTPVVYSPLLGTVADELRAATIPVVNNLDAIGPAPDVIHGQQHFETMTALLRFPNTPAIYFSHDWLDTATPHFPRILRYVAVDYTCRDRLIFEHAIPEERIRVLFNFVDLQRFKPRAPLPARPKRALLFSNYTSEDERLKLTRGACARAGIELDVVGERISKSCTRPEEILPQYDIVFAKGRAALEALAVGCAVVLYGIARLGPMVTTTEFDRLRPLNFGSRALREPISAEVLSREIARYNSEDAAKVSHRVRATAGRDAIINELIALYQEVITEMNEYGHDTEAEYHAASAYLCYVRTLLQQLRDEHLIINNSATMRLQRSLLRVPLLGKMTRSFARLIR